MTTDPNVSEDFTGACPFCGEHEVRYALLAVHFHEPNSEECFIYVVECPSCGRLPAHMTRERIEGSGESS